MGNVFVCFSFVLSLTLTDVCFETYPSCEISGED